MLFVVVSSMVLVEEEMVGTENSEFFGISPSFGGPSI